MRTMEAISDKTYTTEELTAHAEHLATEHKIQVAEFTYADDPPTEGNEMFEGVGAEDARYQAASYPHVRFVTIPKIRGPITYAAALHEFGHIARPNLKQRLRKSGTPSSGVRSGIYDEEAEAWQWAKDHALTWTSEMERYAVLCLVTYVQFAEEDTPVPAHSKIWNWVKRP